MQRTVSQYLNMTKYAYVFVLRTRWNDILMSNSGITEYLVVDAKYKHNVVPEEEYIDLEPVLNDLYIDADKFVEPIKKVEITHVRCCRNSRHCRNDC